MARKAASQKVTSPAPKTAGCEASICSASDVPERGMPMTNTGSSDDEACTTQDPMKAALKVPRMSSTRRARMAAS